MSSTRTSTKNIRKELTALGQEDLSWELEKVVRSQVQEYKEMPEEDRREKFEEFKKTLTDIPLIIKDAEDLMDIFDSDFDKEYGTVENIYIPLGGIIYHPSSLLKNADPKQYIKEFEHYVNHDLDDNIQLKKEPKTIVNEIKRKVFAREFPIK